MSMSDPVADLMTRLRNASLARHNVVVIPKSVLKLNILKILKEEGFIRSYQEKNEDGRFFLMVALGYDKHRKSLIQGIRRISTPGCRVYVSKDKLPRVRNGLGIAIVSTSRGVMSDAQARDAGIGGEFLCEVW